MSNHTKIKSQFNQFIKTLKVDELTSYEIKKILIPLQVWEQRLEKELYY